VRVLKKTPLLLAPVAVLVFGCVHLRNSESNLAFPILPEAQKPLTHELEDQVKTLYALGPFIPDQFNLNPADGKSVYGYELAFSYLEDQVQALGYQPTVFQTWNKQTTKMSSVSPRGIQYREDKNYPIWSLQISIPARSQNNQTLPLLIGTSLDTNPVLRKKEDGPLPTLKHCADHHYSAVAGLLALAHLFKTEPPSIPVDIIFWSNGETRDHKNGFSSDFHAQWLKDSDHQKYLGVVSLLSIGRFYDEKGTQSLPPFSSLIFGNIEKGDYISVISQRSSMDFLADFTNKFEAGSDFPFRGCALPNFLIGSKIKDTDIHPYGERLNLPGIIFSDTSHFRHPASTGEVKTKYFTPEELTYDSFAAFVIALHQTLVKW